MQVTSRVTVSYLGECSWHRPRELGRQCCRIRLDGQRWWSRTGLSALTIASCARI